VNRGSGHLAKLRDDSYMAQSGELTTSNERAEAPRVAMLKSGLEVATRVLILFRRDGHSAQIIRRLLNFQFRVRRREDQNLRPRLRARPDYSQLDSPPSLLRLRSHILVSYPLLYLIVAASNILFRG
jgi:hypothetical protein